MTALLGLVAMIGIVGTIFGAVAPQASRATVVSAFTSVMAACALVLALNVLHSGHVVNLTVPQVLPVTGLEFRLDPLGALFVAMTSIVVIAVSVFNVGYSDLHPMSRTAASSLSLFVTSMLLVPTAWSVMTFLLLWETMALTSLVLVLTDYRRSDNVRRAAVWYAVLTQLGAAVISFGLIALATKIDSQNFETILMRSHELSPWFRGSIFLLTFLGFASKAGAVPLHVWLPKAHVEAPSAVSALMSAAMVNLGIYGIIRVGDTLLGGGSSWWWIVVIAFGAVSAMYGSIHAATSTDLKRLLAYSTTDNLGLILIAVGTAGLMETTGHPLFAALALFAGLFHLVSHSLFKGTLFLSAGSILYATGTRDLDLLGGLSKRMPIAASIFAIGAFAIAALPPLCGFVSEWLLLQSLLHGLSSSTTDAIVLMPLCVAALALTGGLTAAAFVKSFGVGMLGIPRSQVAADALEPPALMNIGSGMLAVLCVMAGVAPVMLIDMLAHAVLSVHETGRSFIIARGLSLAVSGARSVFNPTLIAVVVAGSFVLVFCARAILARHHEKRLALAWGSGRELQTSRMTYTATSFGEPLQRVFDDVLQPSRDLDVSHRGESRYYLESIRIATREGDVFDRLLYKPVFRAVRAVGFKARLLQNGSVHRYLAYGLVGLIVILLVAR